MHTQYILIKYVLSKAAILSHILPTTHVCAYKLMYIYEYVVSDCIAIASVYQYVYSRTRLYVLCTHGFVDHFLNCGKTGYMY